ncbi:MAG: tetratricopeptide repeat protein [bacterium]
MKEMIEDLQKRLDALKDKVEHFKPEDDRVIRDEIKKIYVSIVNGLKVLNKAQEDVRTIVQEFKRHKSKHMGVGQFYSFVKSQTSAELDLATLLDRAWNHIVMEDFDEAIRVLKRVLDIEPTNTRGLGFMCLALMDKEQYDDAMMYLQKVLVIDPENAFALNNLGYICYKKGIWGEAIEHLGKAARQKKDRMASLYANYYLGLVYHERAMLDDAVKFFEKALKLGPNLQEAYYYLGLTEVKRYEFERAVTYFEKGIVIDSRSKYGRLCKEECGKIRPLTHSPVNRDEDDRKQAKNKE